MNWKGFVLTYGVNYALPVLLGLLPILLVARGLPPGMDRTRIHRAAVATFLLTRLGLGLLMYPVALTHPEGDLAYHAGRAVLVLEGQVPGRDFENPHGLLFPYWNAAFVLLGGDRPGFGVLLGFFVADAMACIASGVLFRALLPGRSALAALACVVASPLLWAQEVFRGQDESVFLMCLASAAALSAHGRHAAAGAVAGLGVVLAKVTFFPYGLVIVLVGAARAGASWWRPVMAAAVAPLLAVGCLLASGGSPLDVLRYQGEKLDMWGYNASTVLRWIGGTSGRVLSIAFYGAATIAIAAMSAWRTRSWSAAASACNGLILVHGMVILTMPFLVLDYPTQALTFLCALTFSGGSGARTWQLATSLAVLGAVIGLTRSLPDGSVLGLTIPVVLGSHVPFLAAAWRDSVAPRAPRDEACPA
jgi:hypothetical protein